MVEDNITCLVIREDGDRVLGRCRLVRAGRQKQTHGVIPAVAIEVSANDGNAAGAIRARGPFGIGRSVYSIGDLLIAFGGFLIPFIWLQEPAEASSQDVRSANFAYRSQRLRVSSSPA